MASYNYDKNGSLAKTIAVSLDSPEPIPEVGHKLTVDGTTYAITNIQLAAAGKLDIQGVELYSKATCDAGGGPPMLKANEAGVPLPVGPWFAPDEVEVFNKNAAAESVYTLERLVELAKEKRAVVCPSKWGTHHKPASFVVNMTGRLIYGLFELGLFVKEKPVKAEKAKKLPKGWEHDSPGGIPGGKED